MQSNKSVDKVAFSVGAENELLLQFQKTFRGTGILSKGLVMSNASNEKTSYLVFLIIRDCQSYRFFGILVFLIFTPLCSKVMKYLLGEMLLLHGFHVVEADEFSTYL